MSPDLSKRCAAGGLRRAARAVTQLYDAELMAAGITITQFGILNALAKAKVATQGVLGAMLSLDSTTLSRTLLPLVESGWIERCPGTDRREHCLRLTAAGRKEWRQASSRWQRAQKRLRNALGDQSWNQLQRVLDRTMKATSRSLKPGY
jgi:DNA-binding MarR family transcriptional regulator